MKKIEIGKASYQQLKDSNAKLLDALKTWQKFWDTMPKGQMGKISFDVGLFNDGFIKTREAISQAEAIL